MKLPVLNYRARKVLGFFVAKGLLILPDVAPGGTVKLNISDVLWVAENIEPRVLSVLPAAIIHFPRSFLDPEKIPHKLKAVIAAIKSGAEDGPDLPGFPFTEFRRWAYFTLKDKRSRPLGEQKVRKTYRFKPDVVKTLEQRARMENISETALIESLIEQRSLR